MRVLLLDNYDSFTWNLAHALEQCGATVEVVLNDALAVGEILERGYEAWVISPGPGRPEESGICLDLVRAATTGPPLLGVCLGHQALAQAHGARIVRAPVLMHGKTSAIHHDGQRLFRGLGRPFVATRYHSLVVDEPSLPRAFEITARTEDGVIMGIRHRELPLYGVQFHPEAVLTVEGPRLLANFLEIAARRRPGLPGLSIGDK